MGLTSRSMEDSGAKYALINCGVQKVSGENIVSMWPRDWSCNILVKKVAVFCSCLKSLNNVKPMCFELILFSEEMSKQSGIDSAVFLLVVTLIKIYNKKKNNLSRVNFKNINFEGKRTTRK